MLPAKSHSFDVAHPKASTSHILIVSRSLRVIPDRRTPGTAQLPFVPLTQLRTCLHEWAKTTLGPTVVHSLTMMRDEVDGRQLTLV